MSHVPDCYVLLSEESRIVGASVADGRPTELSFLTDNAPLGYRVVRVQGPVRLYDFVEPSKIVDDPRVSVQYLRAVAAKACALMADLTLLTICPVCAKSVSPAAIGSVGHIRDCSVVELMRALDRLN